MKKNKKGTGVGAKILDLMSLMTVMMLFIGLIWQ